MSKYGYIPNFKNRASDINHLTAIAGITKQLTDNERITREKEENLIEWISYYRANPARFIVEYLGVDILTPWQQMLIHAMFENINIVWIASRGLGKTYLSVLYCVARSILYPGTQIVFTSKTQGQAVKAMSQKIKDLQANYPNIQCEIFNFVTGNEPKVEFHNGSIIWIVSPKDSALGLRANVILIDEYRKVDDTIIKTVFRKFLTKPRSLPFKTKKDKNGKYIYAEYPYEKNTEIYISSQAPTYEQGFMRYTYAIQNMTKMDGYLAFCIPYYLGVKDGIITKDLIISELKEEGADMAIFSLEYECIPFGASSNAYFTDEMFKYNRNIHKIFIPMSPEDYIKYKGELSKNPFYLPKERGEKRILGVDSASTNSPNSANTIVECLRLIPKESRSGNQYYEKQVVYIKNIVGDMNHTTQAKIIKRIFTLFEADMIAIDAQGNSLGVIHQMILPSYDEDYNLHYPAFDTINDQDINDMCREPEDERLTAMYSIKNAGVSSYDLQHRYNTYTRSELVSRHVKLPVDEADGEVYLRRYQKFDNQDAYTQAEWISVYKQCDALIQEALSLEKKMQDGGTKVTLVMPAKSVLKRRDRIIALQYALLYAQEIEIQDFKYQIKTDLAKYNFASGIRSKGGSLNPFANNYNKVKNFGWNNRRR